MTNGKIMTAGTPIYKSQHVGDQEVSAVMTRKMNFADWVKCGKQPREGMELPDAELADLTKELMGKCLNAGMSVSEIARKFGCKYKDAYNRYYRLGFAKPAEQEPLNDEPVADQEPAQPSYEFIQPTPEALEQFFTEEPLPANDPVDEQVVQEILEHLPTIKDSGQRTEFPTGAVRDMHEGKGRYDLLPWNAIHAIAVHCEQGALKYGERNVDQGIPTHSLADSATRHISCYYRGMKDEPHTVSAAWNLLWLIEMELTKPEMQDIPSRMIRP